MKVIVIGGGIGIIKVTDIPIGRAITRLAPPVFATPDRKEAA